MLVTEFGMNTLVRMQLWNAELAIIVIDPSISMSPEQQAPPWLFLFTQPVVTAVPVAVGAKVGDALGEYVVPGEGAIVGLAVGRTLLEGVEDGCTDG